MVAKGKTARILHCFGDEESFEAEKLTSRLAVLGSNLLHSIVGITPEQWRGAAHGGRSIQPDFVREFPAIGGRPGPGRLIRLANAIKPYDLVLSYGWGAIDVAMAHTMFTDALSLPPLVHHETVLTGEEQRLSKRRKWYRRIALGKASGLVVPTERLEEIALVDWQQPLGRVKHFAPGVVIPEKLVSARPDALRGLVKRDGELWIGTSSGSSVSALIDALGEAPSEWHVVVLGDGDENEMLQQRAEQSEVSHRVHFAGSDTVLTKATGLFDAYADMAASAGVPHDALTAMAHGLPVIAAKGGTAEPVLSPANAVILAENAEPLALRDAILRLTDEPERRALGEANRAHAVANFSEAQALERYRRLYASALGMEIKA